ncbi:hypothetical protein BAUCODRAFT_204480 [Baudoinia panamericana UAMH 10762]|uniref:Uncharacterized protein n=1 Tax=Baudoinia panamericana (strain UAMH 10762) TaxID=717646 RepID=M2MW94_BAUPA|nr:uncharacterized protein BAUCODRAFT_204480 [Baudoinia panamericana UAMH 10762]EMD01267.1 hypothetical protein BAUCODRAFT_204480 [Baudoinia panamericana UAMH 10762]
MLEHLDIKVSPFTKSLPTHASSRSTRADQSQPEHIANLMRYRRYLLQASIVIGKLRSRK